MKIVRTTFFDKSLKKLGATAKDLQKLEDALIANPMAGDVIQGLEGARKVRFGLGGAASRVAGVRSMFW